MKKKNPKIYMEFLISSGIAAEMIKALNELSFDIYEVCKLLQGLGPNIKIYIPINGEAYIAAAKGGDKICFSLVQAASPNSISLPIQQFNNILLCLKKTSHLINENNFLGAPLLMLGNYHGGFLSLVNGDTHWDNIIQIFNNLGFMNLQRLVVEFYGIDWNFPIYENSIISNTIIKDSVYQAGGITYHAEFHTKGIEYWSGNDAHIARYALILRPIL